MDEIVYFAAGLTIITTIIIQVVKSAGIIPKKAAIYVSVLIGVVVGAAAYFIPELKADLSLPAHLLGGLIVGASASGIYDFSKQTKTDIDDTIK